VRGVVVNPPARGEWRGPKGLAAARRDAIVLAMAFSLLGLMLAIGGALHAPWFDEAQSWLIARDADPWTILNRITRYEGTPALWTLLLWGFQRLGGSYAGLWLVSSSLAMAGAWLVLYRSPFPLWLRIGFVFGYFFLFQFSVVARSYAFDLLFFPLLASLFPSRLERSRVYGLTLGLMANANAHGFILALPLAAEFTLRLASDWRRGLGDGRRVAGLALFGLMGLAAVLQAWPPADPHFDSLGRVFPSVARPLVELAMAFGETWGIDSPFMIEMSAMIAVVFLIPVAALCRTAGHGWLALCLFASLFLFMAIITENYYHSGFFVLLVIFGLWVSWRAVPDLEPAMRTWLQAALGLLVAIQVIGGVSAWTRSLTAPYSPGKAAASYLESRLGRRSQLIAAEGDYTFSVQPYFRRNIFANAGGGRPQAFFEWRDDFGVAIVPSVTDWQRIARSGRYDLMLLAPESPGTVTPTSTFVEIAQGSGYCVARRFVVKRIGRNRIPALDEIFVFERCQRVSGD
jgi:hypothetical protein